MKILKFTVIFCFCATSYGHGQNLDDDPNAVKYNITFSTGYSFQNFFDGNGFIEEHYKFKPKSGWLNWGRIYRLGYRISEKNEIHITYHSLYMTHLDTSFHSGKFGDVRRRINRNFGLSVSRSVISLKRFYLDFTIGGIYRHGSESYLVSYGVFDEHYEHNELRDFGGNVGLKLSRYLWKGRITLSAEADYTWYFYRYDTGGTPFPRDPGSAQQMMRLMFTAGYRFWKTKNHSP